MSTRCLIGYYNGNTDIVTYSYCHFDGYPDGVGKTLLKYYNTSTLAEQISQIGAFSTLEDTYEKTLANKYEEDMKCSEVWYCEYSRLDDFGVDYLYLYRYGRWNFKPVGFYDLEEMQNIGLEYF